MLLIILSLMILFLLGLLMVLIPFLLIKDNKNKNFITKILNNFGTGLFVGGMIILYQTNYSDWIIVSFGIFIILINLIIENIWGI